MATVNSMDPHEGQADATRTHYVYFNGTGADVMRAPAGTMSCLDGSQTVPVEFSAEVRVRTGQGG